MWDPAFRFAEVRRAHATGHQRRFILKDVHGARGNEDVPGLMAALDTGAGCNGLAFRIVTEEVEAETEILWRREQVLPAYNAEFIDVDLSDARISTLTFVADLDADVIDGNLTRDEQIRYFATGNGFLGTSLDYLANIERHFEKLGIIDDDVTALLHDTRAYVAAGA
jgi:cation transport protein ChaC